MSLLQYLQEILKISLVLFSYCEHKGRKENKLKIADISK